MGIESIIILFGSIGFVLMGLFALYMSVEQFYFISRCSAVGSARGLGP